jgi:hypothetical protein
MRDDLTNRSPEDEAFHLLRAVVEGDAHKSDIAVSLREHGITSAEDMVETIRKASNGRSAATKRSLRPIDLKGRRAQTPPEVVRKIVQVPPQIPVLLNGVLYDPKDLVRFNGTELHFVAVRSRDYLLAIDDRSIIANWHDHLYLSAISAATDYGGINPQETPAAPSSGGTDDSPQDYGGVNPQNSPEGFSRGGPSSEHPGMWGAGNGGDDGPPRTIFWSDHWYSGASLELSPNRGYYDLTEVGSGLFGWFGDWNDKISSVQLLGTQIAVLHEHVRWAGATFTCTYSMDDLGFVGWNDRASSVETW